MDVAKHPVSSVHTREYDALRALLREIREAKGVSQEELSERLGRPVTYIGKVELGARRLDVVELLQVCSLLSIEGADFIRRLEQRVRAPS